MAVQTRDEFIDVLQKSSLLNHARFEEAHRLAASLDEPAAIAKRLVQHNLISRWQAQQLLGGRHTLIINKYRLLDLLGSDAVGPIYLAEHTQMDRRVVLKTLAKREGNSAASIERFLSESAALAGLDHRHLCHIYDVDREGDFYFLVMEHVQGRNIQQVVDGDGALGCEAAAGLIALAAEALGYAHQRGILHLGLRPDRLMVDGHGMLKVLDIGIARLADKSSPDSSAIQSADTFAYQAPEQASDAEPDARADVYALGAVLYLLLTGEAAPPVAITAENNGSAAQSPDVRKLRRDVPEDLAKICRKMMATKPQDRYATASEAAAALEAWLQQAETARAAVLAKTAAKPRTAAENISKPPTEPSAGTFAINLDGPATGSGPQIVVSPRKENNRMKVIGGAIGLVLLVGIVGAALMFRGGGANPDPDDDTAAAGSTGTTAAPPAEDPAQPAAGDDEEAVLAVDAVTGPPDLKFTKQVDNSIIVDGKIAAAAEYKVVAKSEAPSITGLKIEVRPHYLPDGKGKPANFRLSEIHVESAADEKFTAPTPVKIVHATADYDEPKLAATMALDGDSKTHWGADSQADRKHWAIFWFDKPLTGASLAKPVWIRATLDQADAKQQVYQFQLAAVSAVPPPRATDQLRGSPTGSAGSTPVAYWRFEKPAAAGAPNAAAPAVEDTSGSENHLVAPTGSAPPRFAATVAGGKVRGTDEPNTQCLDDLKPAATKGAAWGLTTVASRTPRDLASLRLDAWTIEASFSVDQMGLTHTLVGKDGPPKAGAKAILQLRVRGDNDKVEVEATDAAGHVRQVFSKEPVVPGRWYHVAATSDGKQMRLYVDAGDGGGLELQGSQQFAGALAQGPGEWSVGRGFVDGQPADDALALIDEVRISPAALEPPQMLMYATPAELAQQKGAVTAQQAVAAAASGPIKFHELKILNIQGPEGVEFQPQEDGSLFATGANPDTAVYTIRAHTQLTGITGIRLEAMGDHRLPGRGPGWHKNPDKTLEGNFVVTALTVAATARESERRPALIAWKKAEADTSQDKFNVTSLADRKGAGWGIAPAVGKGHYAVLTAERPFGYAGGTWLTITIEQKLGAAQTLGRFRVTAMTGDKEGENPVDGIQAADLFINPLGKVPQVVKLPDLPAEGAAAGPEHTAAVTLGVIHAPPNQVVGMRLLGGETAVDVEGSSLRLEQNFKAGDKSKKWKILLRRADKGSGEDPIIAETAMVGNELKFRWTETGARDPVANYLRNCVLELSVGTQRRGVALREPVEMEKLDLGFGRGTSRPRVEIPWLPKTATLKFAIPAKQEGFPEYSFSAESAEVVKGKLEVKFNPEGQLDLVSVIAASPIKSSLQFNVSALCTLGPNAKRTPYSRSKVQKLGQQTTGQVETAKIRVAKLKNPPPGFQAGPDKDAKIAYLEKEISGAESLIKQLLGLLEKAAEVEKAGGLPVRVFLDVEEYQVTLARVKTE